MIGLEVDGKPLLRNSLYEELEWQHRNCDEIITNTKSAPFMSLVRGLETYEDFDNVILVWGTRVKKELAYKEFLEGLNEHEIWGEITQGKFKFYPTVTREEFENTGRVTTAMYENKVQDKLGYQN